MGVAFACLLSVTALVCFALAMDRHHRQAFGRAPSGRERAAWRGLGVLLTTVAPVPWIAQEGPTMALVTWIFCGTPLAGIAAVAVFALLGERERRQPHSPGRRVARRPSASR
jgi:hypothetical protein